MNIIACGFTLLLFSHNDDDDGGSGCGAGAVDINIDCNFVLACVENKPLTLCTHIIEPHHSLLLLLWAK